MLNNNPTQHNFQHFQHTTVVMLFKTLTSKIEDTYKVVGIKGKNEMLYNIYSFVYSMTLEMHIVVKENTQVEVELLHRLKDNKKLYYKAIVTQDNMEDVLVSIDMCL